MSGLQEVFDDHYVFVGFFLTLLFYWSYEIRYLGNVVQQEKDY